MKCDANLDMRLEAPTIIRFLIIMIRKYVLQEKCKASKTGICILTI